MSDNNHFDKLREMLQQVDPTGEYASVRKSLDRQTTRLESHTPRTEGAVLDSRRVKSVAQAEADMALESLDRLKQGKKIDQQHRFVLEAIVMPFHRPVIDIVDNKLIAEQLTNTWDHLAEQSVRSKLESCFWSIGRINVPALRSLAYAGTGFVVGTNLLMTNRHVAEIFAEGVGRTLRFEPLHPTAVDFYHEKGQTRSESLSVKRVVMVHPYWDMALIEVDELPGNRVPLELGTADPTTLVDREVVVVGYPGYDPDGDEEFQQIQNRIFRGAYYVKRLQPGLLRTRRRVENYQVVEAISHDCSTLGGNSGSAVLLVPKSAEEPIQVVGLHFGGTYLVANYAVSPYDLAQDRRIVDEGVRFTPRIEPREDFYGPIWSRTAIDPTDVGEVASPPERVTPPPHTNSVTFPQVDTGAVSVTIPLHVTFGLGTLQPAAAQSVPITPPPTEGLFRPRRERDLADMAQFSAESLLATEFRWQTALSLALACSLSSEDSTTVESTAHDVWGLESCRFVEADETQCFVASSAQAAVIAFRGSESLGDWLGNLNMIGTTRSYGRVHRGFLGAFQVVDAQLRAILANSPGRPVLITGHSLGGALATIAAAEWEGQLPIAWVYTYGQPAVGKGIFSSFMAQHYRSNFMRFVNDDDIVARVPPTYRHVGRLIHFDADGEVQGLLESAAESLGAVIPALAHSPAEPRMLTEPEFDLLRAELLQRRAQARRMGRESTDAVILEGLFPSVSDHSLDEYTTKIAAKTT